MSQISPLVSVYQKMYVCDHSFPIGLCIIIDKVTMHRVHYIYPKHTDGCWQYISRHTVVCVWPKKPAHHTVSILTEKKKMRFSHHFSSVIPYPIETKFATEVPAR